MVLGRLPCSLRAVRCCWYSCSKRCCCKGSMAVPSLASPRQGRTQQGAVPGQGTKLPRSGLVQLCVQPDLRGGSSNEPVTFGRRPVNTALAIGERSMAVFPLEELEPVHPACLIEI